MSKLRADWQTRPLGDLVKDERPICYGVLKPGDFVPDGIPLVRIVDIINDRIDQDRLYKISATLDAEFQRSKLLGDEVLVSIQGTIGRVAIAPRELSGANISRTIARIAVNSLMTPGFLSQWLRSPSGQRALDESVLGTTRDSLNIGVLRRIHLPVPPVSEQRKIAEILDTADEAIRFTERLIAKLQQARQGLLRDLLTRGIDNDRGVRPTCQAVPKLYKDSIAGKIPRQWSGVPVSYCLAGPPINGIYKPAGSIGRGTLMVGQTAFTEDRRIDFGLARRSVVSYGEHARYGLRSRDILVSRVFATLDGVGQPALVGEPPEPAVYESNMMRLRVDTSVAIPEFVFYSLLAKGARKHITKNVKLSNQASVSQSGLSSIPIGLPSLEEQERICAVLESIAIRGRAEKALLAARRLARDGLASDLLTGRVRLGIPE